MTPGQAEETPGSPLALALTQPAPPTTGKGVLMTDLTCACGYEAATPADLADHLGEAFIPLDHDTGTDGRAHAERARDANQPRPAPLTCTCGHAAPDPTGLDEHLLRAFTPADATGLDGHKHAPAQATGHAGSGGPSDA